MLEAGSETEVEEIFFFNDANFLWVMHNFFNPASLRFLRDAINEKMNALDIAILDAGTRQGIEYGIAPDSIRLNTKWYDIWKEADISPLKKRLPIHSTIIYPPQIRTVQDRKSFVPWHQDEAYLLSLYPIGHRDLITCFLPLDDDLENRPTVQFVVDKDQQLIPHIRRENETRNQYELPDQEMFSSGSTVSFNLKLGDALLFGKRVVHRTYFASDEPFLARHSMEFRIISKRGLIMDKDYFDLNRKVFFVHGNKKGGL